MPPLLHRNSDLGLFQTWQFSLYKNTFARLRTSKARTLDPKEASAFIIPFDLGVHSYIDHNNGLPRLASPHGWMAQSLLKVCCVHGLPLPRCERGLQSV